MTVSDRARWREWCALGVLLLPVLTVSISTTALGFAVPALSAALRPTGEELLWIVDVYPLALAGLLLTSGVLGDRIGRRKVLAIGAVGVTAATIYAAFSDSALELIFARALVGVFGATLLPSTLSLMRNIFHDEGQRRLAIAIWSASFAGGGALGPIVGGWLLGHFWWGAIFLLPVPLNALMLATMFFLVPESRNEDSESIDALSVFLSIGAMVPTAYGLKHAAATGLDAFSILPLVFGIACGFFFTRRQLGMEHPLLDVRLFKNRVLTTAAIGNFSSVFVFAGVQFYVSQHIQLIQGLDPVTAGWWLLPGAAASVAVGVLIVYLTRTFPRWLLIGAGTLLMAAGAGLSVFLDVNTGIWLPVLMYVALGVGASAAQALNTDALISAAPPERAGAASGLSETAFELGTSLGVAVLGSVLTTFYGRALSLPEGLSASDYHAVVSTLGAAEEVAAKLSPEAGHLLHTAAQQAFIHAERVTGFTACLGLAAAGILIARSLRKGGLGRVSSPSNS
ncbi:MFS transporter [Dermatophilus congolensis]|uniref:MFS transporter n=1 Tax=Dermatophilus congolensis TaxID=1863 RepID=UPI001AAF8FD9|nr:MFS transporter [Dermatophilus congolensis]MBO3134612.1 MFS transporter [Dermatophilus congolensis]MBO3139093.1 MFS transporter [Dermatophilus congolensis]MBO3141327.1 MFS transporter [Dermatophilus congolensis]MBO3148032.1 MFS transporter [Dermatophilus congolensis]